MGVTIVHTLSCHDAFPQHEVLEIHSCPISSFFLVSFHRFFLCASMFLCLYECMSHVCTWPWMLEEVVRCPGSEVAGDCMWMDLGAESQMEAPCRGSKSSYPLKHLSSPPSSLSTGIISTYEDTTSGLFIWMLIDVWVVSSFWSLWFKLL